jgi:hypothetical protein
VVDSAGVSDVVQWAPLFMPDIFWLDSMALSGNLQDRTPLTDEVGVTVLTQHEDGFWGRTGFDGATDDKWALQA